VSSKAIIAILSKTRLIARMNPHRNPMPRKRMGGVNWREVPPILAIGGDATVTDG
jgi:hypothetical protein